MDFQATQVLEENEEVFSQSTNDKIQIATLEIAGKKYPIFKGITTVGRRPSSDICIDDPTVSKSHAEIEATTKATFISDLKSSNKTRMNNEILRPERFYEVHDGSILVFGIIKGLFMLARPDDDSILVPETPYSGLKQRKGVLSIKKIPCKSKINSTFDDSDDSVILGTQQYDADVFRRPSVPGPSKLSSDSKEQSIHDLQTQSFDNFDSNGLENSTRGSELADNPRNQKQNTIFDIQTQQCSSDFLQLKNSDDQNSKRGELESSRILEARNVSIHDCATQKFDVGSSDHEKSNIFDAATQKFDKPVEISGEMDKDDGNNFSGSHHDENTSIHDRETQRFDRGPPGSKNLSVFDVETQKFDAFVSNAEKSDFQTSNIKDSGTSGRAETSIHDIETQMIENDLLTSKQATILDVETKIYNCTGSKSPKLNVQDVEIRKMENEPSTSKKTNVFDVETQFLDFPESRYQKNNIHDLETLKIGEGDNEFEILDKDKNMKQVQETSRSPSLSETHFDDFAHSFPENIHDVQTQTLQEQNLISNSGRNEAGKGEMDRSMSESPDLLLNHEDILRNSKGETFKNIIEDSETDDEGTIVTEETSESPQKCNKNKDPTRVSKNFKDDSETDEDNFFEKLTRKNSEKPEENVEKSEKKEATTSLGIGRNEIEKDQMSKEKRDVNIQDDSETDDERFSLGHYSKFSEKSHQNGKDTKGFNFRNRKNESKSLGNAKGNQSKNVSNFVDDSDIDEDDLFANLSHSNSSKNGRVTTERVNSVEISDSENEMKNYSKNPVRPPTDYDSDLTDEGNSSKTQTLKRKSKKPNTSTLNESKVSMKRENSKKTASNSFTEVGDEDKSSRRRVDKERLVIDESEESETDDDRHNVEEHKATYKLDNRKNDKSRVIDSGTDEEEIFASKSKSRVKDFDLPKVPERDNSMSSRISEDDADDPSNAPTQIVVPPKSSDRIQELEPTQLVDFPELRPQSPESDLDDFDDDMAPTQVIKRPKRQSIPKSQKNQPRSSNKNGKNVVEDLDSNMEPTQMMDLPIENLPVLPRHEVAEEFYDHDDTAPTQIIDIHQGRFDVPEDPEHVMEIDDQAPTQVLPARIDTSKSDRKKAKSPAKVRVSKANFSDSEIRDENGDDTSNVPIKVNRVTRSKVAEKIDELVPTRITTHPPPEPDLEDFGDDMAPGQVIEVPKRRPYLRLAKKERKSLNENGKTTNEDLEGEPTQIMDFPEDLPVLSHREVSEKFDDHDDTGPTQVIDVHQGRSNDPEDAMDVEEKSPTHIVPNRTSPRKAKINLKESDSRIVRNPRRLRGDISKVNEDQKNNENSATNTESLMGSQESDLSSYFKNVNRLATSTPFTNSARKKKFNLSLSQKETTTVNSASHKVEKSSMDSRESQESSDLNDSVARDLHGLFGNEVIKRKKNDMESTALSTQELEDILKASQSSTNDIPNEKNVYPVQENSIDTPKLRRMGRSQNKVGTTFDKKNVNKPMEDENDQESSSTLRDRSSHPVEEMEPKKSEITLRKSGRNSKKVDEESQDTYFSKLSIKRKRNAIIESLETVEDNTEAVSSKSNENEELVYELGTSGFLDGVAVDSDESIALLKSPRGKRRKVDDTKAPGLGNIGKRVKSTAAAKKANPLPENDDTVPAVKKVNRRGGRVAKETSLATNSSTPATSSIAEDILPVLSSVTNRRLPNKSKAHGSPKTKKITRTPKQPSPPKSVAPIIDEDSEDDVEDVDDYEQLKRMADSYLATSKAQRIKKFNEMETYESTTEVEKPEKPVGRAKKQTKRSAKKPSKVEEVLPGEGITEVERSHFDQEPLERRGRSKNKIDNPSENTVKPEIKPTNRKKIGIKIRGGSVSVLDSSVESRNSSQQSSPGAESEEIQNILESPKKSNGSKNKSSRNKKETLKNEEKPTENVEPVNGEETEGRSRKGVVRRGAKRPSTVYDVEEIGDALNVPTEPSPKMKKMNSELLESPSRAGRSKSGAQIHTVLFTGLSDSDSYRNSVSKLGGSVTDNPTRATILVTDKVRRTFKFFCAVSRSIPIASISWIQASVRAGYFVDPSVFILQDPASEAKFDFKLTRSLSRAKETKLLNGYTIVITSKINQPSVQEIKSMIQVSGGKTVIRAPRSWLPNTVVVSCEEDVPNVRKMLQKAPANHNIPVVGVEFILSGILKQELDTDRYKLKY